MLTAIIDKIRGRDTAPPVRQPLPRELLVAIERATIAARGEPDEHGDTRITVHAVGLGSFNWEGTKPAAARILRHWPEIEEAGARRAARLLADTVAGRMRADFSGDRHRRKGWVFDLTR